MLERASSCLDRGAHLAGMLRHRAPTSNQLLHNVFWQPFIPQSCQLPSSSNGSPRAAERTRLQKQRAWISPRTAESGAAPFLDFLYPPRCLALVRHLESRPEVRTRRMANPSGHRTPLKRNHATLADLRLQPELVEGHSNQFADNSRAQMYSRSPSTRAASASTTRRAKEHGSASLERLYRILQQEQDGPRREKRSPSTVPPEIWRLSREERPGSAAVWPLFQKARAGLDDPLELQQKCMSWLDDRHDHVSSVAFLQIYITLPDSVRVPPDHETVPPTQHDTAVQRYFGIVSQWQPEKPKPKLSLLIPRTLLADAIDMRRWEEAVRILQGFRKTCLDSDRGLDAQQIRYLTMKTMICTGRINALPKRIKVLLDLLRHDQVTPEQVPDLSLILEGMLIALVSWPTRDRHFAPFQDDCRDAQHILTSPYLLQHAAPMFYDEILKLIMRVVPTGPRGPEVGPAEVEMQHAKFGLFTAVYNAFRNGPKFLPSQNLLRQILIGWTEDKLGFAGQYSMGLDGFDIDLLLTDWRNLFGRLDRAALFLLMRKYAQAGRADLVEQCESEYMSLPGKKRDPEHLWPSIHVHALQADYKAAERAFQRLTGQHKVEATSRLWAALIFAYQRANRQGDAIRAYKQLKADGVQPTPFIEGSIATILGRSGDTDALAVLHKSRTASSHRTSTFSINAEMVGLLRGKNIEGAKAKLAEAITRVNAGTVQGSLTICFNTMLTDLAIRNDVVDVGKYYGLMRELKVPADGRTYGALMLAMCKFRQPNRAQYLLEHVMLKEGGIRPTALHYAICMNGYISTGNSKLALELHETMKATKIDPTLMTEAAVLRATAQDLTAGPVHSATNRHAIETVLQSIDRNFDSSGALMLDKGPVPAWFRHESGTPQLAATISCLIYHFGLCHRFEDVEAILDRYLTMTGLADLTDSSMKVVEAVMLVYARARDTRAVERCWQLVLAHAERHRLAQHESLEDTTPPSDASKHHRTPSVLPEFKRVLTLPFHHYIYSLARKNSARETSDMDVLSATFQKLLSYGYIFDNRTWNAYIQYLCRTQPPRTHLAFALTERYLMDDWPGWYPRYSGRRLKHPVTSAHRPAARREGLEYISARYLPPDQLMMQYRTSVLLTAAMLELEKMDAVGGVRGPGDWASLASANEEPDRAGSEDGNAECIKGLNWANVGAQIGNVALLRRQAPKTLEAVKLMPRVPDTLQNAILGRPYSGS